MYPSIVATQFFTKWENKDTPMPSVAHLVNIRIMSQE